MMADAQQPACAMFIAMSVGPLTRSKIYYNLVNISLFEHIY